MSHTAFIALGANLDTPINTVQAAIQTIASTAGITLVRASGLYRTAPLGLAGQPDFINAVIAVETDLSPDDLLTILLNIEAQFGRRRREKNGPRTLDLDVLLYDQLILHHDHLTIPHPRLHLRAFVLVPLAEIAPDLTLPGRGTVGAWLPAVANQAIHRI